MRKNEPSNPEAPPKGLTLDETIALASELHEGQTDQGGAPYIEHCLGTLDNLLALFPDADLTTQRAMVLHDTTEDVEGCDEAYLMSRGCDPATTSVVTELHRDQRDGKTYQEWIALLAWNGSQRAVRAKLADNLHNSRQDRIDQLPPEKRSIAKRYAKARATLLQALRERFGDEPSNVADLLNSGAGCRARTGTPKGNGF